MSYLLQEEELAWCIFPRAMLLPGQQIYCTSMALLGHYLLTLEDVLVQKRGYVRPVLKIFASQARECNLLVQALRELEWREVSFREVSFRHQFLQVRTVPATVVPPPGQNSLSCKRPRKLASLRAAQI